MVVLYSGKSKDSDERNFDEAANDLLKTRACEAAGAIPLQLLDLCPPKSHSSARF
jgi:hypothetical protein